MDLSTSATSKKHVDLNDARYQQSERLRQNSKKNVRSTFTLYDNKEVNKVAVQDISAAYELSDKKMPIGELINKMLDLTIDMEDGVLDAEKDAVYAWKYSVALLSMYEDKIKRQEDFSVFDNGLKNAIVNSQLFMERYPGKYTVRTNFFDPKIKSGLLEDITSTFKAEVLPKIHDAAINKSKIVAEQHQNPILDKIINWAIENYNCTVDSFFEVRNDEETKLFFSVNTIILHLKNGYDMSIIGHVGTDHDDKFAISIFNANDIGLDSHAERIEQKDIQSNLTQATQKDPVDPLTRLLKIERAKNEVLKKQYDILVNIRPMINSDVLKITAAESVVGHDYIWGCEQYRTTHADLPENFKLSDVVLPELELEQEDEVAYKQKSGLIGSLSKMTDSIDKTTFEMKTIDDSKKFESIVNEKKAMGYDLDPVEKEPYSATRPIERAADKPIEVAPAKAPDLKDHSSDELLKDVVTEDIFATLAEPKEKPVEKQFGNPENIEFKMPKLTITNANLQNLSSNKKDDNFDTTATRLPGVVLPKKEEKFDDTPSFTGNAQSMPQKQETLFEQEPEFKPVQPQKQEQPIAQPELLLDDLDSLFA